MPMVWRVINPATAMVLISLSFCGWFIVLPITPSAADANGYLYATDILEVCLRPMICALPVRHRLRNRCALDTSWWSVAWSVNYHTLAG